MHQTEPLKYQTIGVCSLYGLKKGEGTPRSWISQLATSSSILWNPKSQYVYWPTQSIQTVKGKRSCGKTKITMGTIVSYRKSLTINWSTLIILLQIVVPPSFLRPSKSHGIQFAATGRQRMRTWCKLAETNILVATRTPRFNTANT